MGVPEDGELPFDGVSPGFLIWDCDPIPPRILPDRGVRLVELEVTHPQAEALQSALGPIRSESKITFTIGPTPGLRAHLRSPNGDLRL